MIPSSSAAERDVRVELGSLRVRIQLLPGPNPIDLDADQVGALLAHGLSLSPEPPADAPQQPALADGPTRFLVGDFDLGVTTGLRAVRLGLEHALAMTFATLKGTNANMTASPDEPEPSPPGQRELPAVDLDARRRAALAHARNLRTPDMFVELVDFEADFDRYFALVEHGSRLILTRKGQPVVEAMPWEMYRAEQEARAWTSLSYWSSWTSGRFDSDRHAEMVDELMTMPAEPAHPAGDASRTRPETSTPGHAETEGTHADT